MSQFVEKCRLQLGEKFNIDRDVIQSEHIMIELEELELHVEFHVPSESVSSYCRLPAMDSGELELHEHFLMLRQCLSVNYDLFKTNKTLRLSIVDDAPGLVLTSSPVNCKDEHQFVQDLDQLILSAGHAQATLVGVR